MRQGRRSGGGSQRLLNLLLLLALVWAVRVHFSYTTEEAGDAQGYEELQGQDFAPISLPLETLTRAEPTPEPRASSRSALPRTAAPSRRSGASPARSTRSSPSASRASRETSRRGGDRLKHVGRFRREHEAKKPTSKADAAARGGHDKDKEAKRDGPKPLPVLNCTTIANRRLVAPSGNIVDVTLENLGASWVFKFNERIRYAHMATIERLPGLGALVVAWQAAPGSKVDGEERPAVEGLNAQSIYYSISREGAAGAGLNWTAPHVVPMHNMTKGAVWSPVLHADPKGRLWLFFTASRMCKYPKAPPLWEPGGDLKVVKCGLRDSRRTSLADLREARWTPPRTILLQSKQVQKMASVIANKVKILSNGNWVLPFWREHSMHANVTAAGNKCKVMEKRPKLPQRLSDYESLIERYSVAGVLISRNKGQSWRAHGRIFHPLTPLIEGTVSEMHNGKLLMLLRSRTNCVFQSESENGGAVWSTAAPAAIPNPNTKLDMIRVDTKVKGLEGTPATVYMMAFNNHVKMGESSGCAGCRTNLNIAASTDGRKWYIVAEIDREVSPGVRIHYPTLLQNGTSLVVAYSKFYISSLQSGSEDQGIAVKTFDLRSLVAFSSQHKAPLDGTALRKVFDHFISGLTKLDIRHLCCSHEVCCSGKKWPHLARDVNTKYDFRASGGLKWLMKQKDVGRYALRQMAQKLKGKPHRKSVSPDDGKHESASEEEADEGPTLDEALAEIEDIEADVETEPEEDVAPDVAGDLGVNVGAEQMSLGDEGDDAVE